MDQIIEKSKTYYEDVYSVASDDILSKLNDKTIMISWAYGLIGSCIVDVLMVRNIKFNSNITVIANGRNEKKMVSRFSSYIWNPNFKFISQDINIPFNYEGNIDYIMHLASNANPSAYKTDPVGTINGNIIGIKNLLDYAKETNVKRVLYTSSWEVYGEADSSIKEFKEDFNWYVNPTLSRSCYPNSKRCAETLCVSYSEEYWVDTVIARPSHTYWPNMTENDNRAYAQFLRNVINWEDIVLKSEWKQIRSYTYIVDCAKAFFYILIKWKSKNAYNIANPNSVISIRNMAEMIAKIGNKKVIIDIPKETIPSPMQCGVLNTDKLQSIGFKAKYGIEEWYTNCFKILKEIIKN